jgi:prepilin-type N-terminal cleavage/methylation domain-containing protein
MKISSRQASAFTLVEIMLVVAIIGLTLTMGLPSFLRALKREGMGKAERDLVKACEDARSAAIMHNQPTYLVLRPMDRTFSVPGAFDAVEIPKDVDLETIGINFVEVKGEDEARVRFNPNSTSDEFTVLLHGSDGSLREIDLDVVTALPAVKVLR